MSDHSKVLAEEAWAVYDDAIVDSQRIDDVLAQHEAFRMDAFMDAMADSYDDADEDE